MRKLQWKRQNEARWEGSSQAGDLQWVIALNEQGHFLAVRHHQVRGLSPRWEFLVLEKAIEAIEAFEQIQPERKTPQRLDWSFKHWRWTGYTRHQDGRVFTWGRGLQPANEQVHYVKKPRWCISVTDEDTITPHAGGRFQVTRHPDNTDVSDSRHALLRTYPTLYAAMDACEELEAELASKARPVSPISLELTKDQQALLLYLESLLVEHSGQVIFYSDQPDHAQAEKWAEAGFIGLERAQNNSRSALAYTVTFTEAAWKEAHRLRRERAERMRENAASTS